MRKAIAIELRYFYCYWLKSCSMVLKGLLLLLLTPSLQPIEHADWQLVLNTHTHTHTLSYVIC